MVFYDNLDWIWYYWIVISDYWLSSIDLILLNSDYWFMDVILELLELR